MSRPDWNARPEGEAWVVPFAALQAKSRGRKPRWNVNDAEPATFSDRLFQWESFAPPPADNAEPFTLQWYLAIEHQRHSRQAKWIPKLLEFGKHPGETVLGLGHGLGTDWVQYARHGANVIACSTVSEELSLIRRNFELRGLRGRFLHANPLNLPLLDNSVDVILVNGLLHEVRQPPELVEEIYRVLKPGGKVVAVAPAKYGVPFWSRFWRWLPTGLEAAPMDLHASPWHNPDRSPEMLHNYSSRRLWRLFGPFTNHRIQKRHIRRRELPWLSRCLPRVWLERWFGNFLILKAFKPILATQQRAAA